MSVYWLLENLWVSPVYEWGFPYPFAMFCGLVGEFDLLGGERQVEFQRHLKMFISFGCKSLAQKMLDDPMPVMGRKEMGGIPGEEVVPIYMRKYEELKRKKEKGKE